MDGGRRLLRPLKEVFAVFEPSFAAYAGLADDAGLAGRGRGFSAAPRRRSALSASALRLAAAPATWTLFSLGFLGFVWLYGCLLNGDYAGFVAEHGSLQDFVARSVGFRLKTVTILGEHELSEGEILATAGIKPTHSLLFLNAARLRERLKALPFVKDASVSKLYPNRLLIEIQERRPVALWQKDGQVQVIAADGTPIDGLHDPRYFSLPRAVGDGANAHIGDYLALLDAAGDLRSRIEAGLFIAGRRWTLKFKNGVEVALPETAPTEAVAKLVTLDRNYRVLEKDVLSLDLRIPGRLIATLPEDVARTRMELIAHPNKKGGQT